MSLLDLPPALEPPSGVKSNFVNPQSQAPMVVVACIVCQVLIIPISLLRFYTNIYVNRSLKAEDSK